MPRVTDLRSDAARCADQPEPAGPHSEIARPQAFVADSGATRLLFKPEPNTMQRNDNPSDLAAVKLINRPSLVGGSMGRLPENLPFSSLATQSSTHA
jgi:hypothetical protein